jgi:putative membrane protein
MNKIRDKILIYLKGMLMWACDVIPWVSGWTIAVITGIYERLIQAIKNVVPNLKLFFTWKWKTFWKNIDGNFLLCLILWIWTSIVLFANIITSAMENYPILIWSFFVGLILISAVFLGKQVKRNWKTILCLIIFWVLAFFILPQLILPFPSLLLGGGLSFVEL